jgi:predicted DNA-binding transcriptional regulator AlpA
MSRPPPQSDRIPGADVPAIVMAPLVFTVAEFCCAHKISRSKLYQLWHSGTGPRSIKIGSKNLITAEAASAWRRQLDAGTDKPALTPEKEDGHAVEVVAPENTS